jgi:hypothetical protein
LQPSSSPPPEELVLVGSPELVVPLEPEALPELLPLALPELLELPPPEELPDELLDPPELDELLLLVPASTTGAPPSPPAKIRSAHW